MRFDFSVISSWIEPGSKVLDLGCGTGELIHHLVTIKNAKASGIEQNEAKVFQCIEKGLSTLHGDMMTEIEDYAEKSFDYVILSQTLQQVRNPDELIKKMLYVAPKAIVSFPNFSYWRIRLALLIQGKAPISNALPYQWYNTPNIRVITLHDFRIFAHSLGVSILKEVDINTDHRQLKGNVVNFWPNLLASYGIFLIGKPN